jgi:hypothetical protein
MTCTDKALDRSLLISNTLDVLIEWNMYFDTIAIIVQYLTL